MRIVRNSHGVWGSLCFAVKKRALEPSTEAVGIEMRARARMARLDGSVVEAARLEWRAIRQQQRGVSRCQKGSRRHRQRVRRLTVRNRNACHRASTRIVRRFGVIAVEDLGVRNMAAAARGALQEPGRNVRAKAGLNRSILTQT